MKSFVSWLGLRPDLLVADLKKARGQFADDFDNGPGHEVIAFAALAAYLIIPILMLTGMIG